MMKEYSNIGFEDGNNEGNTFASIQVPDGTTRSSLIVITSYRFLILISKFN